MRSGSRQENRNFSKAFTLIQEIGGAGDRRKKRPSRGWWDNSEIHDSQKLLPPCVLRGMRKEWMEPKVWNLKESLNHSLQSQPWPREEGRGFHVGSMRCTGSENWSTLASPSTLLCSLPPRPLTDQAKPEDKGLREPGKCSVLPHKAWQAKSREWSLKLKDIW